MEKHTILSFFLALAGLSAAAQVGAPYIHDPSTIQFCDGKYYTFGTGGGGLISADGWVWEGGAGRPGGGRRHRRWRGACGTRERGGGRGGRGSSRLLLAAPKPGKFLGFGGGR